MREMKTLSEIVSAERERLRVRGNPADYAPATLDVGDLKALLDAVDALHKIARWAARTAPGYPDHACSRCVPGGDVVIPDFVCAQHMALDITKAAGG